MTAPTTTTAQLDRPVRFRSHVELILDRADAEPDRVLLGDATRQLTAAQFRRGVRNAAIDLLARGITPGRVVALAAPISLEAVLVRYALGLIGCAGVVCPNTDDPDRLNGFLTVVAADELICFPETAGVSVAPLLSLRTHVITEVELDLDLDGLALDLAGGPGVAPDAMAVLVTSGGTTGHSKASRRTFAEWRRALAAPPSTSRRQLICTPLAYIAQILLDQTLIGGGTVILRDGFEPAEVLRTIEAERITHLCLVEPRLVELADHPDLADRDLSSLVAISHVGADAAPSLRRRLHERLGSHLAHPYGASESGLISLLAPTEYGDDAESGRGSVGRLLPGVEVRIEAVDGTVLEGRATGRIVVRSAGVAHDYAGHRDDPAFRPGGWYDTGDCGYLDPDGYLHLRGRAVDERLVAGAGVFPVDLQNALCAVPGVAYAVAVPSAGAVDRFDAVAVPLAGASLNGPDLRAQVSPRLGLDRVIILDRMPVTEQGKPDRRAIDALLAAE